MSAVVSLKAEESSPRKHSELLALLSLGIPLAGAQLAQLLMSITDTVMLGRLSSDAMAAGSLASNSAILLLIVGFGVLSGIPPLIAEARGRNDAVAPRQIMTTGFWLATAVSIFISLALCFMEPFLKSVGEDPALAHGAGAYSLVFAWGIPGAMWTATFRLTLAALERPRPALIILVSALGLNIVLNWILIFGHWGVPALGLPGSAYATTTVNWLMAIALGGYIRWCRVFPRPANALQLMEFRYRLTSLLAMGWPIAITSALEYGLFCCTSLVMGFFGAAALAAHQICIGIAALTFMVPMSLGQAASVRVGFHSGAGRLLIARHAGYAALALGVGFMGCAAISMWLGSDRLLSLYVRAGDPEHDAVMAIGHRLLIAAAIFQVFDGAQAVASGSLRGLKDTRIPMAASAFGYWALGLPIGCFAAFRLGYGPIGLWMGFIAGLSTMAILLNVRFAVLTSRLIRTAESINNSAVPSPF